MFDYKKEGIDDLLKKKVDFGYMFAQEKVIMLRDLPVVINVVKKKASHQSQEEAGIKANKLRREILSGWAAQGFQSFINDKFEAFFEELKTQDGGAGTNGK